MTAPSSEFHRFIVSMLPHGHESDCVEPDTRLSDVGFDSFGKVALLVAIENEFGIEIPETELTRENFQTVRSAWLIVAPRLQDRTSRTTYVDEA
jgi:acyl carrier protein